LKEDTEYRIKFYSKYDGATGHQLIKAEGLLDNANLTTVFELPDLIEIYNVKLYFDNGLLLKRWDASQISKYQQFIENVFQRLKEKIGNLSNDNFIEELETLDFNQNKDFWKLLNNINSLKKISNDQILEVLNKSGWQLHNILSNSKIVKKYGNSIREYMIENPKTCELLLSTFETVDKRQSKEVLYLPKQLTLLDKERIIVSYLESENPNLNYIRLIEKAKNSNTFRISAKTRLLARKLSIKLNNQILESGAVQTCRICIKVDKDQREPIVVEKEGISIQYSYSASIFDNINEPKSLKYIFDYAFNFLDESGCITMISKKSELSIFERVRLVSKNEYLYGIAFINKEYKSDLQINAFSKYLMNEGQSIEKVLNYYVEFINQFISPNKFSFRFPTTELSSLEKIRTLLPDYESLLKQYNCFISEGKIDHELINIDAKPLNISDVESLTDKMYLYSGSDKLKSIINIFYSDQSSLFYVKPFEGKYSCLADLLIEEDVQLSNFETFQREDIENLIEQGYLEITNDNFVKPRNDTLIYLLGEFHTKGTTCYYCYPTVFQEEIDKLIKSNLIRCEMKLFSIEERKYLNYHLNMKEFTNGFDLRNKYLHGTNSSNISTHDHDYIRILKMIILTLLKIEIDLTLSNENSC